jgi:hypothetical protein
MLEGNTVEGLVKHIKREFDSEGNKVYKVLSISNQIGWHSYFRGNH